VSTVPDDVGIPSLAHARLAIPFVPRRLVFVPSERQISPRRPQILRGESLLAVPLEGELHFVMHLAVTESRVNFSFQRRGVELDPHEFRANRLRTHIRLSVDDEIEISNRAIHASCGEVDGAIGDDTTDVVCGIEPLCCIAENLAHVIALEPVGELHDEICERRRRVQ